MPWQVRQEGAPEALAYPGPEPILAGLLAGIWLQTDEVKGPPDRDWTALEAHTAFEEAVADPDPPPVDAGGDSHLGMDPPIDVCLVLLISFSLTITYASLERAIEVPGDQPEEKGTNVVNVKYEQIKDKVFRVTARMEGEKGVVKVEGKQVPVDQISLE